MFDVVKRGCMVFALAAVLGAGSAYAAKPLKATDGAPFAHLYSDMPADPAIRFGRLANGVTYMIRANPTPKGAATLQMRIDGGYLAEAEDEQGMTYLISRLAYDGSKAIPEGLDSWLPTNGLDMVLGKDLVFDTEATRYQLELPASDKAGLDKGLFVMQQIAGELTLADDDIRNEAYTVAAQGTAATASAKRAYDDMRKWYFPGMAFAHRDMGGVPDVMLYSEAERVHTFYHSRYRPENVTLILVGDFDPDLAEQRIKAAFGDWKGQGTPTAAAEFGTYKNQPPRAKLITYPGVPDVVVFGWAQPLDEHYQTRAMGETDLKQAVVTSIFSQRLARIAGKPDSHMLEAGMGPSRIGHTAMSFNLYIKPKPDDALAAMSEAAGLIQQLRTYGVSQAEIDEVYAKFLHDRETAVASSPSRRSADWVAEMSRTMDQNAVTSSPQQDLDFYREARAGITPETLKPVIDGIFSEGPGIALMGETFGGIDEKVVLAAYDTAIAADIAPPVHVERTPWPYTQFGAPTAVVKRETLAATGVTHLVYGNGLNIYLKPRSETANDVHIRLTVDGGLSRFAPDTTAPIFVSGQMPFLTGSLGRISYEDLSAELTTHTVSLALNVEDGSAGFSGHTTRADAGFQLQVLMAYYSDYRPSEADFQRAMGGMDDYYAALTNNAQMISRNQVARLLHNNDVRFGPGNPQDILTREKVQDVFDTLFAPAPLTLTIAGDYDPATIETQIGETFGSLPPLPASAGIPESADKITFAPAGTDKLLRYRSNDNRALFIMAWPTTDYYSDVKTSAGLAVLRRIMDDRFFAAHKQDYGMSSPGLFESVQSDYVKGYGYFSVAMPSLVADDSPLYANIKTLFTDLTLKPVSPEELERARAAVIRDGERRLRDNEVWTAEMARFGQPGVEADFARYAAIVKAVSAADLQSLARTYLKPENTVRIRIIPLDNSGNAS